MDAEGGIAAIAIVDTSPRVRPADLEVLQQLHSPLPLQGELPKAEGVPPLLVGLSVY